MKHRTVQLLALLAALLVGQSSARADLFFSQDGNANGLFLINTTTGAATLAGSGITGVNGRTAGLSPSGTP